MVLWRPFIYQSKTYDLSHLHPFEIELIQEDGNKTEYEIYFKLSRSGKKKLLNLFVESAYVRDQHYKVSKAKRRKPIRFVILARNVEEKRPIKVPK